VAQRIRLSMDFLVPDDSPISERQYKQLMKAAEDYTRVVLVPEAKIPIVKSGEPHLTVHAHHSTRQISCRGCLELSDDEMGHVPGL
jgi:hypothetical protein